MSTDTGAGYTDDRSTVKNFATSASRDHPHRNDVESPVPPEPGREPAGSARAQPVPERQQQAGPNA